MRRLSLVLSTSLLTLACASTEAGAPDGGGAASGSGGAGAFGAGAATGSGAAAATGGAGAGVAAGGTGGSGGGTGATTGTGGSGATGTGGSGAITGSGGAGAVTGTGGTGAAAGAGGVGGGSDNGPCDDQSLLPVPEDPAELGPYELGVRTVTMGRLTVEIVYPAAAGSTAGLSEATYDVRDWLPPQEKSKVPDSASPAVTPVWGSIYRDVPIDEEHGPYPVVINIHGTASFRIANGSTMTHWASRGFVVVSADYPGMSLTDQLNFACGYPTTGAQDVPGDLDTEMAALKAPSGDIAFLDGNIDMTRVAVAGHSQGACLAALSSTLENVKVVIPMSGTTPVSSSSTLESIMWVAGMDDAVIGYQTDLIGNIVCPNAQFGGNKGAFNMSPGPPDVIKRIAGITGGGHLVPTDLCQTNAQGRNAVEEAQADGVCGIDTAVVIGLPALFDCGTISMEDGLHAVNYATTAALEETLQCRDRSAQFANIQTNVPEIGDFVEDK